MKRIHCFAALCIAALSLLAAQSCDKKTPEAPGDAYLTIDRTEFAVNADGGKLYALVGSNADVVVNPRASWLRAEMTDEQDGYNFRITVDKNTSPYTRTANIRLSALRCDDIMLTVVQSAAGGEVPDEASCELLSFSLLSAENGFSATFNINRSAHTASAKYLKWIDRENPEMLIPTFTFTGTSVTVGGREIVSGETAVSFAEPVDFVVHAENGDTQTYKITLNCPQINKELPVLRLQPASEINSKDTYVKTKLTLYSPYTTEGWWSPDDEEAEVRGRGNSTWILPKKPYRIKFPSKFSPIGLNHAKAKSWVILAHDMDKSLLRNHLAFEMSRVLFDRNENWHDPSAIMFTPCSQFVNVYMNDDYHGVYQMSDQMEQDDGRIAVEKLTDKDGSDPAKITGGHILETDIHAVENPVERFYSRYRSISMNHKYPKDDEHDPAQYTYMENFVADAENALYSSNFKDPVNGWRKWFDEKTLIDFIIVKELAGDMDGYTSTYMYKRRGVDKIFFGPIWDVDKGWDNDKRTGGHTSDKANNLMIHAGFQMPNCNGTDWFNRFWEDETLRQAVAKRWADKRDALVARINAALDERVAAMPLAVEANFTKWEFYYQASTEANMPAATYSAEISRIRSLTSTRASVLDGLFSK